MSTIWLLAILLSAFAPMQSYAYEVADERETEKQETYKTTSDNDFDAENIEILNEDINKRTINTKTFKKADGTYEQVIYSQPVHYNQDGKLEEIKNELVRNNIKQTYDITENQFDVSFPVMMQKESAIQVQLDEMFLSWKIINTKNSEGLVESKSAHAQSTDIRDIKTNEQTIRYQNVKDHTDTEYIVQGFEVKENIILKKYQTDYAIEFEYQMENLFLHMDEDGNLQFLNNEDELIYSVEPLYMFDQDNNVSYDVSYEINHISKDVFRLTIKPQNEWLKHAKYPVVIDPTIILKNNQSIFDTYINSGSAGTNYSNSWLVNVANTYSETMHGLVSFNLPQALSGKVIQHASLNMHLQNGANNDQVSLYEIFDTVAIDEVTWSDDPDHDENTIIDYEIYAPNNASVFKFNITSSVTKWANQGVTLVPGFILKSKSLQSISFYSTQEQNSQYRPTVHITYSEPDGLHDYWTYQSYSAGSAGTALVSDYTGAITYTHTDLNFSTDKQSIGLTMIYHSGRKDENIGYGQGYKTNYHFSVGVDSHRFILDPTGKKTYYPVITSNIAEMIFTQQQGYTYEYFLAEDGSQSILIERHQDLFVTYLLYTVNHYLYEFDDSYRLIKITDQKANLGLTISYVSTSSRIAQVTDGVWQ